LIRTRKSDPFLATDGFFATCTRWVSGEAIWEWHPVRPAWRTQDRLSPRLVSVMPLLARFHDVMTGFPSTPTSPRLFAGVPWLLERVEQIRGLAHALPQRTRSAAGVDAALGDLAGIAAGSDFQESFEDQFIHTGGGVWIWMSSIGKYYSEAARILKPGGVLVVNDAHPVRFVFNDGTPWSDLHRYRAVALPYTTTEGRPACEYFWTVADMLQAALDAGFALLTVSSEGRWSSGATVIVAEQAARRWRRTISPLRGASSGSMMSPSRPWCARSAW